MINITLFILFIVQQMVGGNVGQLLEPNHVSLLKAVAATTGGQATGCL